MLKRKYYTLSLHESSVSVTINTEPGFFVPYAYIHFEFDSHTGTVTVTNTPPAATRASGIQDGTIDLSAGQDAFIKDADVGTITLVPTTLNKAVTVTVSWPDPLL